ncbi:MAG: type II secretion system F family protein [Candidatus Liptonbacteria bacterium]
MLYHYIAADKTGRVVEADYDADDLAGVLQHINSRELRPVAVRPVKPSSFGLSLSGGRITLPDKVFLTKYLSLMLKVGTDLLSAINILIADFEGPAMKNFLLEVRENLTKGRPFYEAFAKHPKYFSEVMVNLVRAAEASGNLQKTFDDLSTSLQRDADLQNRVRSALIYPILLLVTSMVVVIFLVTFALPKIAKVFADTGMNPPTFSRIVFAVGLFINDHIYGVLASIILTIVFSIYFFFFTMVGRRVGDRIIGGLPVIKQTHRDLAVQRFSATFSSLMRAGLPIIQAIKITAKVVGTEEFRVALVRIADEGLAKGISIGESFRREKVFPQVVTNLIAVSEKAGHLEDVLETISEFYASNVEANVRALVSVLEPLLLITMGLMVGGISLAIIIPIYQLTNQF